MPRFVKAAEKGEVEEGKGRVINIEGRVLALFRVKDEYFAIGNTCLHRGGPLGEGDLKGYVVTCPWHGWKYDVRTGSFAVIPPLRVRTFPVKQEGDSLLVDVGDSDRGQH
jgi:nitrite reductase/ring-hydroxylating ferredoxin subunit